MKGRAERETLFFGGFVLLIGVTAAANDEERECGRG